MNVLTRFFLVALLLACATIGLLAQADVHGVPPGQQSTDLKSPIRTASGAESFPLAGPAFPPPLGLNFLPIGAPDAAGRIGGKNWYFSGVQLSAKTQTYWGPVNGQVILSLDGFTVTSAETLDVSFVSLASGVVAWSGTSQFWDQSNGFGPYGISVSFVLTVTDSVTGAPVTLVDAASVGLPAQVGAVVPVTPGLHYRANLQFLVSGMPALDFFDLYADGTHGPAFSSFTAGFYWGDVVIDPLDFGNVLVGGFKDDSVTIHNYSLGIRTISPGAVATDGHFSVPAFPATPIASLDSAKFWVQYTPSPGPSSGWLLFVHDGVSTPDSGEVTGTGVMSVVVHKRQDADGDSSTTFDQYPIPWHLELHRDSVSGGGTLVGQNDSTELVVDDLLPGTYIAVEADSGAAWVRINGNQTRYDTIVLLSTPVTDVTFVNFKPNTVIVRKFRDKDGLFATGGDRTPKSWHLEVHRSSPDGPLIASTDDTVLTVSNLGDDTYYAVEVDSGLWVQLGYVLDGSPTTSSDTAVGVSLSNGQTSVVEFVNAPPIYGTAFRSFDADSLALDVDNKGKVNKPVKRKAVRVEFCTEVVNDSAGVNGLHMEFSAAIEQSFPFTTDPPSTMINPDGKRKKWDFVFGGPIAVGETVKVCGFGKVGKPIKVSKYYWTTGGVKEGIALKNPPIIPNAPRNPMPNRVNALQDAYTLGAFTATEGLRVGKNRALPPPDSSKFYGWVTHKKYGDVLKSLYVSKLVPHTHDGTPAGFLFMKKQSKLPKSKQNNKLLAAMVALKLNIKASELGITPAGFGDLIYDNGAGNPMNGKSIGEISEIADSIVMGYYAAGMRLFFTPEVYDSVYAAIRDINKSFEGALDTVSFAAALEFTGSRPLYEVSYLHADTSLLPPKIRPVAALPLEVPDVFELSANYPNPFNPTTTIEFSLAEDSRVTLKIYDVLGREVATLINGETYDGGSDEVTFDASSLASGVYLYRLVAEPIVDAETGAMGPAVTLVRKMVLLK